MLSSTDICLIMLNKGFIFIFWSSCHVERSEWANISWSHSFLYVNQIFFLALLFPITKGYSPYFSIFKLWQLSFPPHIPRNIQFSALIHDLCGKTIPWNFDLFTRKKNSVIVHEYQFEEIFHGFWNFHEKAEFFGGKCPFRSTWLPPLNIYHTLSFTF